MKSQFKRLRKDEYVLDEFVMRMTKKKRELIKELDHRHLDYGRFA